VHGVEGRAEKTVNQPMDLTVRARTDVLVTGKEYKAAGEVLPEPQSP
jgi:hypothetical protein